MPLQATLHYHPDLVRHAVLCFWRRSTGRRTLLVSFGIMSTLATVPVLTALGTAKPGIEGLAMMIGCLAILSCYTSISGLVKAEMFPVEIRALGVGLPYALTVAIFGGTADMVALWFKDIGLETGFYWYVTACIACSLLVYLWMPDTRETSLIDRDPH